ncbi:MAG TPA: M23 family metallopeptidase [Mesorhizobium sp.]|jgi:hypothetical protein
MLKPGIHAFALLLGSTALAAAIELGMPAQCTLGEDCFVQQFPDLDPGANAVDSYCGSATYDGHDGLDLRVLSLVDVARGVPVLAMADGTVVGVRDESPDKMIEGQAQAQAVSREGCGNLALIDHGDGYQTRYCHMRHGTVSVRKGDSVKRGQQIGLIGASGMAEFPHVEIAVSKDGKTLDPVTGRALDAGCLRDLAEAKPLFARDVVAAFGTGEAQMLAIGLSGNVVDYRQLSQLGPPPVARSNSANGVGWGWFINLRQGDRVTVRLTEPGGAIVAEQTTQPMDHSKATYSAFAGKRGAPSPGDYEVYAAVIRDGKPVVEKRAIVTVQ